MIYALLVEGNHAYIGKSNNPKQRLYTHKSSLRLNKHHCKGLQALHDKGSSINLIVLDPGNTDDEKGYIGLMSCFGYTILNHLLTDEYGEIMSEMFLNHPTRSANIGKASRERWLNPEYQNKMSEIFTNLYNTDEYKQKQRKAHPGKPFKLYKDGVYLGVFESLNAACESRGISPGNLHGVLNGKARQTKGYTAEYIKADH